MSNKQMTYVSPHTGKVYDIIEVPQSRVSYREYMNPATKYIKEYIEYQFFNDGQKVAFTHTLEEEYLKGFFGEIEGVYASWSTSSRD